MPTSTKYELRKKIRGLLLLLVLLMIVEISFIFPDFMDNSITTSRDSQSHQPQVILESSTASARTNVLRSNGVVSGNRDAQQPSLNTTIFSKEHYQTIAESLSRPFPYWESHHSHHSWCSSQHWKSSDLRHGRVLNATGLLYVKNPKTASSTIAGIILRIATQNYVNENQTTSAESAHTANLTTNEPTKKSSCMASTGHIIHPGMYYKHRDLEQSFLIGSVREPTSRAMSRVWHHHISRQNNEPTDDFILNVALKSTSSQIGVVSKGQGGFQTAYLSMRAPNGIPVNSAWKKEDPDKVRRPARVHSKVRDIIQEYDFMFITERMDECVVALQLLLNVSVGHVLDLSAKTPGQYMPLNGTHCFKQRKRTPNSPAVQRYLESEEWYAQNYGDFILYEVAHKSLDMTIEQTIGRFTFEKALSRYKTLKSEMEKICAPQAVFPCSSEGVYQPSLSAKNCYEGDSGCGYPCIDQFFANKTTKIVHR